MAKVYHKFTIEAPASKVFELLSTLPGLQSWWMKDSRGSPELNGELEFGKKEMFYNKMKVTKSEDNKHIEWEILESIGPTEDSKIWNGTKVSFELEEKQLARLDGKTATVVLFKHDDWPQGSEDTKFFAEVNWHWAFFTQGLKNVAEGREGNAM